MVEEVSSSGDEANWCDPDGEMLRLIQDAAERVAAVRPVPVITLAATDARFWRLSGVPAYIYGCSPDRMGTYDESVGRGGVSQRRTRTRAGRRRLLGSARRMTSMTPLEEELLARLDASRDRSIAFLRTSCACPRRTRQGTRAPPPAFCTGAARGGTAVGGAFAASGDAEFRLQLSRGQCGSTSCAQWAHRRVPGCGG